MGSSEYFDPDTGIIHMTDFHQGSSIAGNTSEGREFGLQNTSFNDVKIKILSIDYKLEIFTSNGLGGGDFNVTGFNNSYDAFGTVVFGVSNQNETPANLHEVSDFTGTSAWPVHWGTWLTMAGKPVTISKRWKPRKLAMSSEQVAFISVRSELQSQTAPYWYGSMYIRAVRL